MGEIPDAPHRLLELLNPFGVLGFGVYPQLGRRTCLLLEEDGGFEGHRVDAGKILRKRLVFDEKVGVSEILSKLRKPLRVP